MSSPSPQSKRPCTNAEMTSRDFAVDGSARLRPHAEALQDASWVETLRATVKNGTVKGKVVLDLSAGLGFWSMLAARSGAQHVYSIEPTCLANQLRQCVVDNGLADIITVYQCEVDRDLRLPVGQVDVIIAPWVAQGRIIHHTVVDRVLFARDRFLAADGIILPNKLTLYAYGVSDDPLVSSQKLEEEVRWWTDVYGFDMSCMAPRTFRTVSASASSAHNMSINRTHRIVTIGQQNICTKPCVLKVLDLMECDKRDLSFDAEFCLVPRTCDAVVVSGIVLDFDVLFEHVAAVDQQELVFGRTTAVRANGDISAWRSIVMDLDELIVMDSGRALHGRLRCAFAEAPFSAPAPRLCRWAISLSKRFALSDESGSCK